MNRFLKGVYDRAPGFVKNMAVSVYGNSLKKKRYGENYHRLYAEEKNNYLLTEDELRDIQLRKLKRLLLESNKHSAYYKELFMDIGLTEKMIIDATDSACLLNKIPFLEKKTLREKMKDICSLDPRRRTVSVAHTSGSTGTPMSIEQDAEAVEYSFVLLRRFYDWMGLPETFRSVRLSGRMITSPKANKPPFWVYNKPMGQLFMSTYHLTEKNLPAYIDELNKFRPALIDGYPSAITVLADYILKSGVMLRSFPQVIATTAETLFDGQREKIEKAFRCKVYNQYASAEGAPFAAQCSGGEMHLWIDTGCFEFINRVPFDDMLDMAEIVVTSFRSLKTPLIRYRIGDSALIYREQRLCGCGSSYPVIHSILGRVDDILYTREKGYVGRMTPAFKEVRGIKESQIIQKDIDHIDIYIVKDKDYSAKEEILLMENIKNRLGYDVSYNIIYKQVIPRGKNGKFRAVIRQFEI